MKQWKEWFLFDFISDMELKAEECCIEQIYTIINMELVRNWVDHDHHVNNVKRDEYHMHYIKFK